jgi:hypothetical protein
MKTDEPSNFGNLLKPNDEAKDEDDPILNNSISESNFSRDSVEDVIDSELDAAIMNNPHHSSSKDLKLNFDPDSIL